MKTFVYEGGKITQPGIYKGVPLEVYHEDCCAGPSISSSGLRKIIWESPAHYFAESYLNPRRKQRKEAKHFSVGRAVHHLILGEAYFSRHYCIQPAEYTDERTGEVKKWNGNATFCREWAAAQARAKRTPITQTDADNIVGMAQSLAQHDAVKAGILSGWIERSIFWQDKATGIWLKWRPDCIPNDSGDFADLKTTTSVLWVDLMRSIDDYAYYQQGALGRWACRDVLNMVMQTFNLVFVEKENPWCCRTVIVKDHLLEKGEKLNRLALDTMHRCLKSGRWPGPGGEGDIAEYIEPSEFAMKRIDDVINRLTGDAP